MIQRFKLKLWLFDKRTQGHFEVLFPGKRDEQNAPIQNRYYPWKHCAYKLSVFVISETTMVIFVPYYSKIRGILILIVVVVLILIYGLCVTM